MIENTGWSREFDDPIILPDGTELTTLKEAVAYLAKTVPKTERNMPQVLTAAQILTYAAEREIARMVAKGYPNKMIASVLDISCWTVGTYLRRMFAKVGVCSRAALVASLAEAEHLPKIEESNSPDSHESFSHVSDDAPRINQVRTR